MSLKSLINICLTLFIAYTCIPLLILFFTQLICSFHSSYESIIIPINVTEFFLSIFSFPILMARFSLSTLLWLNITKVWIHLVIVCLI